MRKITISVATLLTIAAMPAAFAETITVDFSKATSDDVSAIANGTNPVTLNGFTFACGSKCTLNSKNGVVASYSIGGRSLGGDARCIKFTPSKNGTLKYNVTNSKSTSEQHSVVAKASFDYSKLADNESSVVLNTTLAASANKTISVNLVAGQTYYILASEAQIFYSVSYEEASATTGVTITIPKGSDNAAAKDSVTLQQGIYKFTADDVKSLAVTSKNGSVVCSDPENVVIPNNNTNVMVAATMVSAVSKDTELKVNIALSEASLETVKNVYVQKIAVMINKANEYTNDERLQVYAVEAFALMAQANDMTLDQYNEYVTTNAIKTLDESINTLSTNITNAKAVYDGYAYAQKAYGNEYKDGKWQAITPVEGLLAKQAALKAAYDKIEDQTAKASVTDTYNNAVNEVTGFLSTVNAEYQDATNTDLANYKKLINDRVSGVERIINDAKNAIEKGDGNAISYANVNARITKAKDVYNTQAASLYNLLTGAADGATYNNMYVTALGELNTYLRTITSVTEKNEAYYAKNACTVDTQKELIGMLVTIADDDDNTKTEAIYNVLASYTKTATQLRANYAAANADIEANLTDYLKTQVKDVIGTRKIDSYNTQIATIETSIRALQGKVDNANENYIIKAEAPFCDGYDKDKADIRKTIEDLNVKVVKSVANFDANEAANIEIDKVQAAFDIAKTSVGKNVSGTYTQAVKFPTVEKTIQDKITALRTAATTSSNAGTAVDFNFTDDVTTGGKTLYGTTSIKGSITEYKDNADKAFGQYKTVVGALADYDLALNGKGDDPTKEGYEAGLTDIATNTDVTIDGTYGGVSYATKIDEIATQIKGLQDKLNAAVAKTDNEHVTSMNALTTLPTLVTDIKTLSDKYVENATNWNKAQLAQAKDAMLAEATRRVALLDTKNVVLNYDYKDTAAGSDYYTEEDKQNVNTTSYEKETYGKWISDQTDDKGNKIKGLNTLLGECNATVTSINEEIKEAEKPENTDANAIALLSKVVTELTNAETAYNKLKDMAVSVKEQYSAEKLARKTRLEAIKTIQSDLAKVTFGTPNMFETESNNQNTAITNLKDKIAGFFGAETLRVAANVKTLYDAKNVISTAVANLQGLVTKEKANEAANTLFSQKLTTANVDKAISEVSFGDVTSGDAYDFFKAEFQKLKDEYAGIKQAQIDAAGAKAKALGTDNKTLPGSLDATKYTDVTKNMTVKEANLSTRLGEVKDSIVALTSRIKNNESQKKTQDNKAGALDKLRGEVFGIITSAETSSYHRTALETLAKIDGNIAAYKNGVLAAYKIGECDVQHIALESAATSVETSLNTLKNGWNDEYTKAVSLDNEGRKNAFDDSYNSLAKTYSTQVGIITEMSKLSYAQTEGNKDKLEGVVGTDGIYSYAEKIRTLKGEADNVYGNTVSPALYDAEESYKAKAKEYEGKIKELAETYTDAVNAAATSTYETKINAAVQSITEAKTDVMNVLGIDANAATNAFNDVQKIVDNAKAGAAKEGEKYVDPEFAYNLDIKILPALATIDAKIVVDKETAAVSSYETRLNEYRNLANTEKNLIAGYNGEDGTLGAFSKEYDKFVTNSLNAAETEWNKFGTGKKYANYAATKAKLDEFFNSLQKRTINTKVVSHTETYWNAYDANETYHANDNAYNSMLSSIDNVQKTLDKAVDFVNSLFIRNNINIVDRFETCQTNIEQLDRDASKSHDEHTAIMDKVGFEARCANQITAIEDIISGVSGALKTENSDLKLQIGFLQHDYNQATAAQIENPEIDKYKIIISGYTTENDGIVNDRFVGKKDAKGNYIFDAKGNNVKATNEETRLAFIALEKKLVSQNLNLLLCMMPLLPETPRRLYRIVLTH